MKVRTLFATLAAFGVASSLAAQEATHLAVGKEAAAFVAKASDGKEYSLKSLTADGPAFVVFWKERCPHNKTASSLLNTLYKAHGVKMVGFVSASEEGAKGWVTRFGLEYPLIADSERKTIKEYELRYSICTFQIGRDGKVEKVFPGYGKESMDALNAAMAEVSKKKPEVDLSAAPTDLTWG